MAHINSSFSSPFAGVLEINLKGSFYQGGSRDAGFPSGSGNVSVKATVGGNDVAPIDRYAPVSRAHVNYPGGNAVWAVTTSTVAVVYGTGIVSVGFTNLEVTLVLIKR